MSLLEVSNLTFSYAGENLYQDAVMRLFEGEHAVLVGPNGAGKSTLLKLLNKSLSPDKGTIEWVNYKKVGYLDQYAEIDPNKDVKSYLYDVFLPLFEKENRIQELYESISSAPESEYDRILKRAHALEEELEKDNFYAISSTISNVMNGLGLDTSLLDSKINTLSGGMRAKLILGKLLLKEVDILLLDEPTNFLDIKHIDWLINFLNKTPKTFIVVSHDEYFLRSIAKTVFAVEGAQITRYKGNFDFYLQERTLRFEQQAKAFENQQKFIAKTEDFIKKNIVRASTTNMAKSRRKMLEKIERISKPKTDKKIHINFKMAAPTGRDVLKVKDLGIGYQHVLVEPLDFKIVKGDKVAITGKNGIGKSTFIKTIVGQLQPLEGEFTWIDTAKILYYEQEIRLEDEKTPFELVHNENPEFDRKQTMSVLASFGIDFEMANRPLKTLSGGEKTKVKFALTRDEKSNVLILDEPTNHLDKAAKEALKDALIAYQGTLILVSHEKSFYEEVCDYEIHLSNT
ncbi:ABC-F family ATP-binding cassette domain-containing protein [Acholeplasma equirhinis]|uniref:ABC-F family ATP-binding cassette domain-containing protein n=1 Tax=Acholeplasma equirhinis TaxID=555393 RepID=UPI00197AE920|nr:ABC-F family ATP-binding cassette domain-containing protein [Acholeplasma equirhinis]MBN3490520.1 ABC-F family ATP-binding cassette domain-containing protein [Acholeplasma equirhinis]